MVFTSLNFALFFPLAAAVFFLLPHRARWPWLLAANLIFYYTFTSWYFLLLVFVIAVNYLTARVIENERERNPFRARLAFAAAVAAPLGALFLFKYFNFFSGALSHMAAALDLRYSPAILGLVLPAGISFYTFQGLAYVTEVYRGNFRAERHAGIFSAYMSFFPQVLAGPIPRPGRLLPQFREERRFDPGAAVSGLRLMAWGLFKKAVVADRAAVIVTEVFTHPRDYSGLYLVMASLFFTVQIYCDFSGYSDIATGAARVMGFRLDENFRRPYLAGTIQDFWRRWHISLSGWFRDYVYIPLGGNRGSLFRTQLNMTLTMLASALWHGANWTFLAWGGLHAAYAVAGSLTARPRERLRSLLRLERVPRLHGALRVTFIFCCVSFAWIFFRAESMADALYIVTHLGDRLGDLAGALVAGDSARVKALTDVAKLNMVLGYAKIFYKPEVIILYGAMAVLIAVDAAGELARGRDLLATGPAPLRWTVSYLLVMSVALFGLFDATQFLYFRF